MNDYAWYDAVGMAGVGAILVSYLLLQLGRLRSDAPSYLLPNLLGALAVLVSLRYAFNLSAAIVEGFWALISLIGLARWARRKHNGAQTSTSETAEDTVPTQ